MKKSTLVLLSVSVMLNAQNLKQTIEEVLTTNPIIQERLKNYNETKEDITIAEAGYYPKLDLSIGVGFEDGKNAQGQKFDYDVYQGSLTLTQNVFQGFETKYQVEQQKDRAVSAAYSYIEKVNDTSFEMLNQYLQVMKNNELLKNAQANVDINKDILTKVEKLYDAGLTTLSEVNKIESSLALAESNYVVEENTLLDVTYNMQRVLGRYLNSDEMSRPVINVKLPDTKEEAAEFAMRNNPSLLVSKYNIKLAQSTYKEKKSPFYPSLDLELSQQVNKNLSGINGKYENLKAMAYLRYNFFNGFADSAALQKSVSTIHKEVQIKNQLRREVIEGLNLSWAANEKLSKQLELLKKYKKFALKTLTLYSKEYDLGRRSLLDLLSAQNDFIGAKAQIINTEYSLLFAKYRILDAMGTLVTTVVGNQDILYSNVSLGAKAPQNEQDSLPVSYDVDKDLIPDEIDICANSLANSVNTIYGCEDKSKSVKNILKYSGFTFKNETNILTNEAKSNFDNLKADLKKYDLTKLKINLFGNIEAETMLEKELALLSKERAEIIKQKLISIGISEQNISIKANSNQVPLVSNENDEYIQINNRVDIIVNILK